MRQESMVLEETFRAMIIPAQVFELTGLTSLFFLYIGLGLVYSVGLLLVLLVEACGSIYHG